MKILITGGAGFVGTNLAIDLIKQGHEVYCFDNYITGKRENQQKYVKYYNIDLDKKMHLNYLKEPDLIFHLAALARIQPSFKDPLTCIQNNVNSTLNILEYARIRRIPLIYSSSSTYHSGIWKSPYAYSKHSSEEFCKLFSKIYNMKIYSCRFYNVYGDYQITTGDYATVIGIFLDQYKNKKPLTIVGDGNQQRDFTHIDDIVNGLNCMKDKILDNYNGYKVYELGREKPHSINDIADFFGVNYPRKYLPKRPGEYERSLANSTETRKDLNWKANKNIKDYILENL